MGIDMNDVTYRFTSKIEFITGSKKFRTRAQWPVDVLYTVGKDNVVKINKVIWDKCNGDMIDITEFIMPDQIAGIEKEIDDLFWREKAKNEEKLNDDS